MWGAPTWRAGYDGIQHPGLCLRFDERLPKTGTLGLKIKETKDLAKGLATIKFCTVQVGDVEHRADVLPGVGEVKWNSKLEFTLTGEEDFINVSVEGDDAGRPKVVSTCIIPLHEVLAAVHPTMPPPRAHDEHKDKLLPLQVDCKALHATLQHTTALPDHLKEAMTELIAVAYADPPRHDAWFSLYDDKFTLVGLVNLCFYFTPSHYPVLKIPKSPALDTKIKSKPAVKSWFRKAATDASPAISKADKYYGVSVEEATTQSGMAIPVPLTVLADYLGREGLITEGLFRIGGSKANIDAIIDAFKHDTQPTLTDVHDAAGALKAFFRQMPEPVIPFSHYDGFIGIAGDAERSVEEKKTLYQSMVQNLPSQNIAVLKYLMALLNKVAAHSEVNLMTADNLAIVFAPNLLKPEADDAKMMASDAGLAHQAVAMIIKYAQEILPPDQIVIETSPNDSVNSERLSFLTVRRASIDRRSSVSTNPVNELAKALADLEHLRGEVANSKSRRIAAESEATQLREELETLKGQTAEELAQARMELDQSHKQRAEALVQAADEHAAAMILKETQYQKLLADNTALMTEMATQARDTAALVAKLKTQREEEEAQTQAQIARIRQEAEAERLVLAQQQQVELSRIQEDRDKLHERVTELLREMEKTKAESALEREQSRAEAEQAQEQLKQFAMKSVEEKNAIMEKLLAQQQLRMQAQLESSAAITTHREQITDTARTHAKIGPETEGAIINAVSNYIDQQAEVVIRSGVLTKHSSGFPKRWQSRQCTLTTRRLTWVSPHKHNAKTVLGCVNMTDVRSVSVGEGTRFVVSVHTAEGDRMFEFEAQDVSARDVWVKDINAALVKAQQRSTVSKSESLVDVVRRATHEPDSISMHIRSGGEEKSPPLLNAAR